MDRNWVALIEEARVNETPRTVFFGVRRLVVLRYRGEVRVFPDRCPHAGARLSRGRRLDGCIECPRHSWRFRLEDGACPAHPVYQLSLWPVRVTGGWVEIEPPVV